MSKKVLKEQTLKNYDFIDAVSEKLNTVAEQVVDIPLEKISIDTNIRKEYQNINILAKSIEQQTLLQPICVKKQGEYYSIIYGHRRYLAYKMLNEKQPEKYGKIKSIIKSEISSDNIPETQYAENAIRENLSANEIKMFLEGLRGKGLSNMDIAERIHKSANYVEQLFSTIHAINENPALSEVIKKTDFKVSMGDIRKVKALPAKEQVSILKAKAEGKIKSQKELSAAIAKKKLNNTSRQGIKNNRNIAFKTDFYRIHEKKLDIYAFHFDKSKADKKQKLQMIKAVSQILSFLKK